MHYGKKNKVIKNDTLYVYSKYKIYSLHIK